MSRVVIVGGPKTGKTTLAKKMGGRVRHTDDVMHLGWSNGSQQVSRWFEDKEPCVIEGVAGPRALRKFMSRSDAKPCDKVIVLEQVHRLRTVGQKSMAKGVHTVLDEIRPELERRGVEIVRGDR